jgi:hypothetical protein
MKKILLIEDRVKRQKDFIQNLNLNFDNYIDILDNKIDDKYDKFIEDIRNNNFELNNYEVIISHDSIFIDEKRVILQKLKSYCKDNNKTLILFSGNLETYFNNDNGYDEIGLNSKVFYSENLKIFLDEFKNENIAPAILVFGKYWKANILLNVFNKVNIFIDKNKDEDDILIDEFNNYVEIDLLKSLELDLYQMDIEDDWVYLDEIIKFKDNLYKKIEEIADK